MATRLSSFRFRELLVRVSTAAAASSLDEARSLLAGVLNAVEDAIEAGG